MNNHVFRETISLVRLPVVAPIPPEATAVEIASIIAANTAEQLAYNAKVAHAFVEDPLVQQINAVTAPTILAMTLVNTAGGISVFNLLAYLQYIFTQPLLLFGRRKRQQWGVIYNSLTKQPIDLAIVRLLDAKTKQVLQTRVTDRFGRYFFFTKQGEYLLEVVKPGYSFPSLFLKSEKEDAEYLDIHHGELVRLDKESQIFANIPVDPIEKVETPKRILFTAFLQRVRQAAAFSAIPMGMVMVWITPSITTSVLLLVQVGVYILFRKIAVPLKPKSWGAARDAYTKKPISNVIVRIFDKKFNKLLETQVTDRQGRYGFFVKRNVYYVSAEKQAYQKFTSPDIDLTAKEEAIVDQNIEMERVI